MIKQSVESFSWKKRCRTCHRRFKRNGQYCLKSRSCCVSDSVTRFGIKQTLQNILLYVEQYLWIAD